MPILLFLIALTVGGGAYFEYNLERMTSDGFQQQLANRSSEVDSLTPENKQLQSTKAKMLKDIKATESQLEDLNDELKAAQAAQSKRQATIVAAAAKAKAPPSTPVDPSVLGTLTTISGQTYQNCQLLKVDTEGITFSHSQGITKVLFSNLPPEMQKRFGYDPALEEARLRYQEQLQQAGGAPSVMPGPGPTPAAP